MRNKKILFGIAAVAGIATALFLCWWKGAFLPGWIAWQEKELPYHDGTLLLKDREASFWMNGKVLWSPGKDYFVQDALISDIDRDGEEELILLTWKHGSYGSHTPFWVKSRDIALAQHIFIYRYEPGRESRIRAVWMSSDIGYEIGSIGQGKRNTLFVTPRQGEPSLWHWQDFGLKYAGPARTEELTFAACGDNLIHLPLLKKGPPFDYLYDHVRPLVRDADIAALNHETVLVSGNAQVSGFPRFGTPMEVGDAVAGAGFDLVILANNHALDKGMMGIDGTIGFYEEKGIRVAGAHRSGEALAGEDGRNAITWMGKNGIKLAVLAFTEHTNGIPMPEKEPLAVEKVDEDRMAEALGHAAGDADAVIVFMHWGEEYEKEPNEEQRRLARFLCRHGADVVIGSHPHVIQELEEIKDEETGNRTWVFYSLGNLVSAQEDPECQKSGVACFTVRLEADGTVSVVDPRLLTILR